MIKLLVIEGNDSDIRARMRARLGSDTAERYRQTLLTLHPNAEIDIADPSDPNSPIPTREWLSQYQGVAMTGSALNVYERTAVVERQLAFVDAVFAAGVSFFGSCWGMQVAVVVAGGQVERHALGREFGFSRRIQLTQAGQAHPFYKGKPAVFEAPTVHLDHVTHLPAGATVLAANEHSIQALSFNVKRSTVFGVQYHPEYTFLDIVAVAERYQERLLDDGTFESQAAFQAWHADVLAMERTLTKALAFRHGLGAGLLEPKIRLTELKCWLESLSASK